MAIAMATATEPVVCNIEMRYLGGLPKLFAPAVRPGADVVFRNELDIEIVLDFYDSSPFVGAPRFTIPPASILERTALVNANLGTHHFRYMESAKNFVDLWLTIEADGIGKVGFAAKPTESRVVFDVSTQLWEPVGSLEVRFDNSTDEELTLVISGGAQKTLIAKTKGYSQTKPFQFYEDTTVRLIPVQEVRPLESGGTELVDILVEDP